MINADMKTIPVITSFFLVLDLNINNLLKKDINTIKSGISAYAQNQYPISPFITIDKLSIINVLIMANQNGINNPKIIYIEFVINSK